MSDDDVLQNLRENPHWPRRGRLDALAVKAAMIGQLRAARDWAEELTNEWAEEPTNEALASSSVSSEAIAAAPVPLGEYSHLPNRLATFYSHLEHELRTVVGPINPTPDGTTEG